MNDEGKLLADLEEKKEEYLRISAETKKKKIELLDSDVRTITKEWAELTSLTAIAGKGDFVEQDEANYALSAAHRIISREEYQSKSDLAKTIEEWLVFEFTQEVEDFLDFVGAKKKLLIIYESHHDDFDKANWNLIRKHYGNETAARTFMLDELHFNLLKLQILSDKDPYSSQIYDLKEKIAEMEKKKLELKQRMELRQRFFEARRTRLLEMMKAKSGTEGEKNQEADELAGREADAYLRMLETENNEEDVVSYKGGRVIATQRPVSNKIQDTGHKTQEKKMGTRIGAVERWKVGLQERAERYREARATGGGFFGGLKSFFGIEGKAVGGATGTIAAGAKTGALVAVKKIGVGGLIKAGLGKLVGAFSGPVGWAVMALQNKTVRKVLAGIGGALYLWFMNLMASIAAWSTPVLGALGGAIIGFAFGGPVGALVGGLVGFATGALLNLFGFGTVPVATAGILPTFGGLGSAIGTAGVSTSAILTGTTATSVAAISIGGAFASAAAVAVINQTQLNEAFRQDPTVEYGEQQGEKTLVGVKKEVNYDFVTIDSGEDLIYTVTISASKENDLNVEINDTITRLGSDGVYETLKSPEVKKMAMAKGTVEVIKYEPYKILPEYNNSEIVNTVSVIAKTKDGKTEVQKASVTTQVGKPTIFDQPYGFPATGSIPALDYKFGNLNRIHNGTFFNASGSRDFINGGIDILGPAGTPVYSTLEGEVVYANFDWGQERDGCIPTQRETLCKNAVGGAVIIRSKTPGRFRVSFLHLDDSLKVRPGDTVTRGQQLGVTYGGKYGKLPSTIGDTPWHVHYQILLNGGNIFFESSSSVGLCRDGKYIPEPLHHLGDVVSASQVGIKECN